MIIVDYTERLRRLAINDERFVEAALAHDSAPADRALDAKSLALARLAALVAVGGSGPSFGSLTDAAIDSGATAAEIVDVLVGVGNVVGVPRVVAAAPRIALALGHDLEDEGSDTPPSGWHR